MFSLRGSQEHKDYQQQHACQQFEARFGQPLSLKDYRKICGLIKRDRVIFLGSNWSGQFWRLYFGQPKVDVVAVFDLETDQVVTFFTLKMHKTNSKKAEARRQKRFETV